jgi:hypothetical protein
MTDDGFVCFLRKIFQATGRHCPLCILAQGKNLNLLAGRHRYLTLKAKYFFAKKRLNS